MKKIIALSIFLLTITIGNSQNWKHSIIEAKKIAKAESKSIIVVFQGSDWCAPCMKLDHAIWSQSKFKKHAKDHFVMLQVDFPRRKKNALSKTQQEHNNKLAEKYNKNGFFPYVLVLDETGKVLGDTGYKKGMTVEEYIKELESFIQ